MKRILPASLELHRALVSLAARHLSTPCQDDETGGFWLSDLETERAEAALLCAPCLIRAECHDAAVEMDVSWGTWAGFDWTVRPGKPRQRPAA